MADADIQRLIQILTDEAPLHKELLQAMIHRFKKGGNSVVTTSLAEKRAALMKSKAMRVYDTYKDKLDKLTDDEKKELNEAELDYYLAIAGRYYHPPVLVPLPLH